MRCNLGWTVRAMLVGLLAVLAASRAAWAQGLEYVQANYTKYEYRIPARDGKRLFTSVYIPKDQQQRYPILLTRTPYSAGPYGANQYRADLGPSALFGKDGYIFVYQDVRGRWMSEGEFINMRPARPQQGGTGDVDESTDTWDTIEWLIKHLPAHNGRVGMWGISYPGYYTSTGLIDAHPALKAASPQAPIMDWFVGDDWHHNGAFILPHIFNFMAKFGHERPAPTKKFEHPFDHGTPDGYKFFLELGALRNADARYFNGKIGFWNEAMQHGVYDEFWKSRSPRAGLTNIRPAVLTVGGWFDAENLFGALETYRQIEQSSPQAQNTLVMGPWRHGQWSRDPGESLGHVSFHAKTSEFFQERIEFPFFQYHLKDKKPWAPPEAWVFETGTNRWVPCNRWPPEDAVETNLFLRSRGRLSFEPPAKSEAAGGVDQYVSDPAKPVPFIDWTDIGMPPEYMVADQRFAARRPDVLVYQSEVLEEDLTLAGPIEVSLHVSTSGTDSDWIVKVIDVYPDDYPDPAENPAKVRLGGFQQLVRGDVMRGKFRNGFEKPEPFTPDAPTAVRFRLQDVCHAFRSGHRLMVQVQSTWFPLVDRNPQQFLDIYSAQDSDFQKATQRVFHTPDRPSRLRVRVKRG